MSTTAVEAYRALLRTSIRLRRCLGEQLARYGLTGAQYGVLVRIPEEGISLTQLAEASWSDPGNLTGIVDRLERDGLVRRERSPEDRRVVIAKLTESGQRLRDEVVPVHRANIARLLSVFDEEDLQALLTLMTKLDGHISTELRAAP